MDQDALRAELTEAIGTFAVPGAQVGLLRGAEQLVVCAGTHAVDGDLLYVGPFALPRVG